MSAVDLISDAGLASLNTKNLSMRVNIPEAMIYKYYGDMNDLMADVATLYFKFDKMVFKTVMSRKDTNVNKIRLYIDAFSSYYENYYSLSTIIIQYEEFLHNTSTRDIVVDGINTRHEFLKDIFNKAIENKEITDSFTGDELANALTGFVMMSTVARRVNYKKRQYRKEIIQYIDKWLTQLELGHKAD